MIRAIMSGCALWAVCAAVAAHDPHGPLTIEHFPLDKVSAHIHVVHGTQQLPSAATGGFMNNPAAILTSEGFVVVDPGSSTAIAAELLAKLSAVSDLPVIAVFNTHVHGDHWLGNHGIRKAYPEVPIYAHARMIERIEAGEGEDWRKLLLGMTEGAIANTEVVAPNIGLRGGETLQFGGVTLRVHHAGHAHTDHDLMIEVLDDRGLFLGDVVANRRVPHSDVPHDAHFTNTIEVIRTTLEGDAKLYIPGHGRSGGREVPEATLRFLETLHGAVTKYYEQGLADFEMKDRVIDDLAEFRDWHNFEEIGRVITYIYQEVEQENF